jgi:hypothetical protein
MGWVESVKIRKKKNINHEMEPQPEEAPCRGDRGPRKNTEHGTR